jgi:hypothetical protein
MRNSKKPLNPLALALAALMVFSATPTTASAEFEDGDNTTEFVVDLGEQGPGDPDDPGDPGDLTECEGQSTLSVPLSVTATAAEPVITPPIQTPTPQDMLEFFGYKAGDLAMGSVDGGGISYTFELTNANAVGGPVDYERLIAADINGDGKIDSVDIEEVAGYFSKAVTTFTSEPINVTYYTGLCNPAEGEAPSTDQGILSAGRYEMSLDANGVFSTNETAFFDGAAPDNSSIAYLRLQQPMLQGQVFVDPVIAHEAIYGDSNNLMRMFPIAFGDGGTVTTTATIHIFGENPYGSHKATFYYMLEVVPSGQYGSLACLYNQCG